MMHINRKTTLDQVLAHDLHAEGSGGMILNRGRMARRSLLAGLGVASCAALTSSLLVPATAKAHQGDGSGNDPKDVVWGLMGALETLDVDEITSWLHEDVVFQNTGLPDFVGLQGMAQFIGPLALAFESLTVDVVSIVSHGQLVYTERIERCVISASSPMGIRGAELTMKVAGWHEVDDGQVIRWADFWDTRTFITKLGMPLPTP